MVLPTQHRTGCDETTHAHLEILPGRGSFSPGSGSYSYWLCLMNQFQSMQCWVCSVLLTYLTVTTAVLTTILTTGWDWLTISGPSVPVQLTLRLFPVRRVRCNILGFFVLTSGSTSPMCAPPRPRAPSPHHVHFHTYLLREQPLNTAGHLPLCQHALPGATLPLTPGLLLRRRQR